MRTVFRVLILSSLFVSGVAIGLLVGYDKHESWKSDMHMQLRDFASGAGGILVEMAKEGATDDIQVMAREMPGELLKVYATGNCNPAWLTVWLNHVKKNVAPGKAR